MKNKKEVKIMKRYAALLRNINISGKNKIPMSDLKKVFTDMGFTDVSSVLNSGNIVFSAVEEDSKEIQQRIHDKVLAVFRLDISVLVMEMTHLEEVLDHAPSWWGTEDKAVYDNLIFILTGETAEEVCMQIGEHSEGLEQVHVYDDVIFWSFELAGYRKCLWWKKTASKGIAEKLTIRTAGTVRKMCSLT